MKQRISLIISILAVISPICMMVVMLLIEPELGEAIFGGLFFGSIIGTVLGFVSLITDKGESTLITTFSIIPISMLALFLLMLIPV